MTPEQSAILEANRRTARAENRAAASQRTADSLMVQLAETQSLLKDLIDKGDAPTRMRVAKYLEERGL